MNKKSNLSKSYLGLSIPGLLAVLVLASCASVPPKGMAPVELVDTVDLQSYLGRWYEVARFQHSFEKSIVGATAEYSIRPDGKVQVINSGFKNTLEGKYTQVKAVAWVPDTNVPAALKVKFFNLFTSDYLIIGLDEKDYKWAVVGNNSRDFLWFLTREPFIDEALFKKMEEIALSQGFDLTGLYRVPQKQRD